MSSILPREGKGEGPARRAPLKGGKEGLLSFHASRKEEGGFQHRLAVRSCAREEEKESSAYILERRKKEECPVSMYRERGGSWALAIRGGGNSTAVGEEGEG